MFGKKHFGLKFVHQASEKPSENRSETSAREGGSGKQVLGVVMETFSVYYRKNCLKIFQRKKIMIIPVSDYQNTGSVE